MACADLLAKAGKTDEAVALLKEGIKVIPPYKSLFSLYQICADLLAKAGKTDKAVALLKEGIKIIPPDKCLFSLYQTCGDVLAKAGKTHEAAALLIDGIRIIPPDQNLVVLFQDLGEIYCRQAKEADALASLRDSLRRSTGMSMSRPASLNLVSSAWTASSCSSFVKVRFGIHSDQRACSTKRSLRRSSRPASVGRLLKKDRMPFISGKGLPKSGWKNRCAASRMITTGSWSAFSIANARFGLGCSKSTFSISGSPTDSSIRQLPHGGPAQGQSCPPPGSPGGNIPAGPL